MKLKEKDVLVATRARDNAGKAGSRKAITPGVKADADTAAPCRHRALRRAALGGAGEGH